MKNALEAFITLIYSKRFTRSEQYFKGAMEYALGRGDITFDEYVEICKRMGFKCATIARDAVNLLGRDN